jgi:Tol biopolymer transport system component
MSIVAIGSVIYYVTSRQPHDSIIVFTSGRDGNEEIYRMYPDGSGVQRLTYNPCGDYLADISRDGSLIVYNTDTETGTAIYVMNADGTRQRLVTKSAGYHYNPGFSPDNMKIVFHSSRTNNREIYCINIDGTGEQRLTNHPAEDRNPSFSPDGQFIVFQSTRGRIMSATSDIYRTNADGSRVIQLTTGGATQPMYSPDGKWIVYYANHHICIMDAAGGHQRNITPCLGENPHPAFSPDGQEIVFHADGSYGQQLFIVRIDGTRHRQIPDRASDEFKRRVVTIAPIAGRWIQVPRSLNWYPVWGPVKKIDR